MVVLVLVVWNMIITVFSWPNDGALFSLWNFMGSFVAKQRL